METKIPLAELVRARRLAHGNARRLRLQADVSVREMAEAVGVTPGQLSRWERGLSRPRGKTALRWYAAVEDLRQGPADGSIAPSPWVPPDDWRPAA